MLRWFKRQSTGVQTLTIAVIVVLFLALITSGDEGSDDSAASSTTPTAAAEAPVNPERPPGPAADTVIAAFEQTGLPVVAPRDTTDNCVSEFYGCVARVTSNSVTVVVFETVDDAKEFVVEYGRDARRYGATVVSYAAARTPARLRPQYAAVLDAVAKGGDGHAARQRVVTKQRRETRRRQIARERRIAEQQAAAERAAAEATPPPAPAPEPAAAPDYSGMNCSEIGHSFSVPPGSDPEHDADGDGLACESQ